VRCGEVTALAALTGAMEREHVAHDRLEVAGDRLEADASWRIARRDGLTGASERHAGQAGLEDELDRSRREGTVLVLAFLDVEGPQSVDGSHGRAAGDEGLRAVGQVLRRCLRRDDVIVRVERDEYVCAAPGLELVRARTRFQHMTCVLGERCPGTGLSVGLSVADHDDTVASVLARAHAVLTGLRDLRSSGRPGRARRAGRDPR
jgi:diguanylate cyclase (GGDEF)-like protein